MRRHTTSILSVEIGPKEDSEESNTTSTITTISALLLSDLRHQIIPRLLWVDAICVDQNNEDVRNHQVQIMASISHLAIRAMSYQVGLEWRSRWFWNVRRRLRRI